ncbi:MAG: hypothetical protein LUH15_05980 [Tannerellaceae bacterium]|nr:hypothetical protein [Tannerellaceae bacterium]
MDSLILSLEFTIHEDLYMWETTLLNINTNKKVSLLKDIIQRDNTSILMEKSGSNMASLYNIIGCFLEKNIVYIAYEKWGCVNLYQFTFTKSNKFIIEEKIITGHSVLPAFGPLLSKASFNKMENSIYLLLSIKQRYSQEKLVNLYLMKDINDLYLLNLKATPLHSIAMLTLTETNRDWINSIEECNEFDSLDKEDKKDYKTFKKYQENSYYFNKLSSKKAIQKDELFAFFHSEGLEEYDFFNPEELPLPNRKEIELTIKEVLTFCKTDTNIHYLDYILDELNSIVYFFYRDKKIRLKSLHMK